MSEKSCLWCKHFNFLPGDCDYYDGYSSVFVECGKLHWRIDMYKGEEYGDRKGKTKGVLRKSFTKAILCKDYEFEEPK